MTRPVLTTWTFRDAARVPSGVWLLGVVSLLTDVSSEIVNALLPLYLVGTAGVSVAAVGLLEGGAVFIATCTRAVAGVVSDRWQRRKPLVVAGYALAALSRPIIPLTASVSGAVVAKALDRVGKGIRSAPRDALVADLAPPHLRGASFGLRKSLDTVGGFAGPLAAMGLLAATAGDYVTVFWWATIPAAIGVVVLTVAVHEPSRPARAVERPVRWLDTVRLSSASWGAVALVAALGLTRVSEAFLLLRAVSVGSSAATAPLLLVLLHAIYGAASYPVGVLSDRYGRRAPIVVSLVVLAAAHTGLAMATSPAWVFACAALWGLHLGLSQGTLTVLVVDATPPALVGSALGWLSLATGAVVLTGNAVMGVLWTRVGPVAAFVVAAGVTVVVALLVLLAPTTRPSTLHDES